MTPTLTTCAHALGRAFTDTLPRHEQKQLGQFMTGPAIAGFMARRLVARADQERIRLLEPAAGAGILAAAVIEALLAKARRPQHIELLLFEVDLRLIPVLTTLCRRMAAACADAGVVLDWKIEAQDFLLSELALSGRPVDGLFIIANPPFFKLNKATDVRAELHAYAVYGQPNVYALFMAACARLTPANGGWCFITPRSWMNGTYFSAARQTMLRHLDIVALHAFESRRDSFQDDAVLQETVIAWAQGRDAHEASRTIRLSRSQGSDDLDAAEVQALPTARIVRADPHRMLQLPTAHADPFAGWTATLQTYGLEVSTGPVVAFRAAAFLRPQAEPGTVPLLWLQHVGQQAIHWPLQKKREHITAVDATAWMLVGNAPMVILRRFSPKEDPRRVTCAAYLGDLPGAVIGLENHLNYIHRRGGALSPAEAKGLAAFLASQVVDDHFRALAGSTQVNATELRQLPLPPLETLVAIGASLPPRPTLAQADAAVARRLGLAPQRQALACAC